MMDGSGQAVTNAFCAVSAAPPAETRPKPRIPLTPVGRAFSRFLEDSSCSPLAVLQRRRRPQSRPQRIQSQPTSSNTMPHAPEILWAQRSSETDDTKVSYCSPVAEPFELIRTRPFFRSFVQNVLYITINVPDIKAETFKFDLTPTSISFAAKAGK